MMQYKKSLNGLYIITPDLYDTDILLKKTELALRGGKIALVQYRNKSAFLKLRYLQANALLRLCRAYTVPLIINDYPDLCCILNADGVHIGAQDLSVSKVRKIIGIDKIIGVSCYSSLELAYHAYCAGANYIAFGGFYPSLIKKYVVKTSFHLIAQLKKIIPLPVVAIGGITPANCVPLLLQGCNMVAAISSIYMAHMPDQATRDFNMVFNNSALFN